MTVRWNYRWIVVGAALVLAWLAHSWVVWSLDGLIVAVGYACWKWDEQRRRAERARTLPLQIMGEQLKPILNPSGKPLHGDPGDVGDRYYVSRSWPADLTVAGAVITCRHQKGWQFTSAAKANLEREVALCQGGEWVATVDPASAAKRWVLLTRLPEPFVLPKLVHYEDSTGDVYRIPVGVQGDGSPLVFDLNGPSPHMLVAAKTKRGKTSLLNVIVAHVAGNGGLVTVLDPKRVGFKAFRGLHNVKVITGSALGHGAAEAMIDAIGEFKTELERRFVLIEDDDDFDESTLTPWLLVIDEMGSFQMMLREHWLATRPNTRAGMTPPTVGDIAWLLMRARQARMYLVVATQRAEVDALGTGNIREQFDYRIGLGKMSKGTATMLFNDLPVPEFEDTYGRAVTEVIDELEVIQLACHDVDPVKAAKIAREIAARGTTRFTAVEDPSRARARA
jgi:hypothetical protein